MTEKEMQIVGDFKFAFNSDRGTRVLNFLKNYCHFGTQTHVSERPIDSAFEAGKRDVLLLILSKLETNLMDETTNK